MKISLLPTFLLLATAASEAQEKQPDAAQLIREVRYSQADQSFDLTGELSKSGIKVPFKMSMVKEQDMIRFRFTKPTQIISLVLKDNRYTLTEQLAGQPAKELDQKRYGESIRGTDVTFEDISQRFLYWPNPKIIGDANEKVQFAVRRDAWKVQLTNPRRGLGPYSVVHVWVDKENKSLLKVEGYDWNGRKVKRFEVVNLMKDREVGMWLLEKMRVETIDQKGSTKEKTMMEMDKPKRR